MVTMSYLDMLIAVLLVAAIILVIYLIILLKKLSPSIETLQSVMKNCDELTASANKSVQEIEVLVDDVKVAANDMGTSLGSVCELIDGNQNTISAITNLVNSTASIAGLFKRKPKSKKQ